MTYKWDFGNGDILWTNGTFNQLTIDYMYTKFGNYTIKVSSILFPDRISPVRTIALIKWVTFMFTYIPLTSTQSFLQENSIQ